MFSFKTEIWTQQDSNNQSQMLTAVIRRMDRKKSESIRLESLTQIQSTRNPFPKEGYWLKTKQVNPRSSLGKDGKNGVRQLHGRESGRRELAKSELGKGCGPLTGSCVWALGPELVELTGEVIKPFWRYSFAGGGGTGSTSVKQDLRVSYPTSCIHSLPPPLWNVSILLPPPPRHAFPITD